MLVAHEPAELSVKDVADRLGISFPAASRAVEPLVQRGFVERAEDPADRRVKRVRTTKDGDRLVERLVATRIESFEQLLEGFSATERRKLGDALDEILARPEVARYLPKEGHADDPPARDHRAEPQVVDARLDELRPLHDHARQHGRERRAAVDPVRPRRVPVGARVDRSTPTRSRSPCCSSRAGGWATSSAAAAPSCSASSCSRSPPRPPASRRTRRSLVASRAVQGIGAAFMMPATLSIITNAFPAHERGKAIGTWAGVSALALALGPVVGGFLTEQVSWRAIFFLNLPVAAPAVFVTLFATQASHATRPCRAPSTTPASPRSRSGSARSCWRWSRATAGAGARRASSRCSLHPVAGLVAFVVVERRARFPMVEFSFLRSRTFVGHERRSRSWSRSRCSPCSSSWRSTCRTSSATRRSRPASASCPPPS